MNYKNFQDAQDEGCITFFKDKYRPFSNFWYSDVRYKGIVFPTNEHAFVAAKLGHLPNNRWKKIAFDIKDLSPYHVKTFGRQCELRPDWEKRKYGIMKKIVYNKFESNLTLRRLLISTEDRILIEGNTWGDRVWGMIETRSGLVGRNLLGRSLMKARRKLQ